MNAQEYTALADQVNRQTPELAAYDADIAQRQPTVDALQAAVNTAQADVATSTAQRKSAAAMEEGPAKVTALAAADANLAAAQDRLVAANKALAGPASELDAVKGRANAIRAAIALCQSAMTASGLALDAGSMQAQRLVKARSAMWERIKVYRDRLSDYGGYKVAVSGVDKWFHSDPKSKTQQLGLYLMGASVPAVQWKTMDGTFVTMTQALAGAIFQAASAQDQAIFAAAEQHRAAMEAAADPLAYSFSGGWPVVYQG